MDHNKASESCLFVPIGRKWGGKKKKISFAGFGLSHVCITPSHLDITT